MSGEFRVRELAGSTPRSFELVDEANDSRAIVSPERGAIAWAWRAHGRDLFFLDTETLGDRSKNVRGGNPVLFPSPGKLRDDAWSRGARRGTLKQHGFARNLPWRVESTHEDGAARLSLALESTAETRAAYPWDFAVLLTYAVAGPELRVDARVTNRSPDAMPFGLGFHPYFLVTDKESVKIPTNATVAFDNVTKRTVSFAGFDLAKGEVDVHLLDHGRQDARLDFGARDGGGGVVLRGSPEFMHWVVWTLPGRDFVCLEPWTCPGDALNTGERLIELAPGASRSLTMVYEYRAA